MEREFYEIGNIEPSDYDNDVWSSGEFKHHCSPHMEVIEDFDLADDSWGLE